MAFYKKINFWEEYTPLSLCIWFLTPNWKGCLNVIVQSIKISLEILNTNAPDRSMTILLQHPGTAVREVFKNLSNGKIPLRGAPPPQCPTGTRYPTRTRSFFQYPIRTRFVFKIFGYFGYRVFQNTMFLTWKMASRSNKILTNIILYHLH